MIRINEYDLKVKSMPFQADTKIIRSSRDGFNIIKEFYGDDMFIYESFFLLLLNRANKVIGFVKVSQGGIAGTVVDPIIVAKYCIDTLSKGVVLAHNHPSGNNKPSEQDIRITTQIKQGLSLFDIKVIDHIIICNKDEYYSFADNGNL